MFTKKKEKKTKGSFWCKIFLKFPLIDQQNKNGEILLNLIQWMNFHHFRLKVAKSQFCFLFYVNFKYTLHHLSDPSGNFLSYDFFCIFKLKILLVKCENLKCFFHILCFAFKIEKNRNNGGLNGSFSKKVNN